MHYEIKINTRSYDTYWPQSRARHDGPITGPVTLNGHGEVARYVTRSEAEAAVTVLSRDLPEQVSSLTVDEVETAEEVV